MKNILKIAVLLISFSLFLSFGYHFRNDISKKNISIEKAIKEKLVEASFTGAGGYQGECIELNIKSIAPRDTIIRIEPGRRLVSKDSSLQDILIIKEIQLLLAKGETKQIKIFGFCCQATDGAPGKGAIYDVGFMTDSSFIMLAEFLGKTNLPLNVIQNAVWVLSNNHPLNSISNKNESDKPTMKELFMLLSKIKKTKYEYPWYSLEYKQDTAQLFTNRPVKFEGEFEYSITGPSNVDLIIRTSDNHMLKRLFVNRPHHPDNYVHRFSIDVENWPKGKYYMILYIDNQQKIKREFEL